VYGGKIYRPRENVEGGRGGGGVGGGVICG